MKQVQPERKVIKIDPEIGKQVDILSAYAGMQIKEYVEKLITEDFKAKGLK